MGKKYKAAAALVDNKKFYSVADAIELAKKTSYTKFDSSIDIAIKLNLDTTKAEQQLRGNLTLPHYFGKLPTLLVIDDTLSSEKAREAKIDFFGGAEKIADIKEGWLDFDIMITTPKFMPELAKLGKLLGPKGLMPNPKLGTVTPNTLKAALEFKQGKAAYRTDTYGNIHMQIGKVSSDSEALVQNANAIIQFILSKRPTTIKGEYVQKISISSSMGPAVKVAKA